LSSKKFTNSVNLLIFLLTNAFSKKIQNLEAAVALHLMYYNFIRIHQTLKVSPAMAAGVTDHLWEISDIIKLFENKKSN